METLMQILHLEDDPADAELVQATLTQAGLVFRITRVQTQGEFETALRDNGTDLILADYRLPSYDGMSALQLVQERCREIPFIFVSGTMGEAAAIEGLTRGATDYVLKQNLSRLPSAVRRAMREARNRRERRQAREALQRSNMINAARIRLMQFAGTHSLDELLEETVNEAEKATDSLIGFYHFVDDDQQALTLQNWSTRTKARFCKARGKGLHYPIADAGVWVDCVRERKPVVHNDYMSLTHRKGLPEGHAEVVRQLVVPVMRGGKVKAILGVGNKPADYSRKDVEAMSLLADLVWEITERKQAEQQIAMMSFALNGIHEAAFMVDENARFQYVNDEACRNVGYSRDELLTMGVSDIIPEFPMERWPGRWNDLKERGALTFEGRFKTRGDRIFPVEINANFFEYEGRSFGIGLARDITERKKAERERLANLKFFENMDRVNRAIQGADDVERMMKDVLDVVLSIFDCDRAFLLYPCDPESPTWTCPMERNKPEYPGVRDLKLEMPMDPQVAEIFRIQLAADGPVTFGPGTPHALPEDVSEQFGIKCFMSMAVFPKTGSPWQFGIHQCTHARTWTAEEMRMFEAIGRRLADGLSSLLSYRDLHKNEEFLHNVVENIPNMIFVKDAQTLRFVRFNKAGEQLVGYPREELLGKTDYDFFPREEADFFTAKDRQVLDGKALVDIPEETIRNRGNEERILHTQKIPLLDEAGTPRFLLGISEDITERKKLEEQLRQAQKMEAVGQLAGGVAHDFNNMLGVIIGYAELALGKTGRDDSLRKNLEGILAAGFRSSEITRQLLAFARKQTIAPKILDLNETVEGLLKLLRRLIGENIDLAWLPGAKLWPIKMDTSQIDQIPANLCVNARDAIDGVGRITIETHKADFDDAYCTEHKGFQPGEYVVLAVSDNGGGMDKSIMDKIFEPFFTTKGVGLGTGLGLATVYGIVKQNEGFINVYSEPKHGSAFKVYLPRHMDPAGQEPKATPEPQDLSGHETILVVEDEIMNLELVELMLERYGYRVLPASSPGEALLTAKGHPGEIHLLLTDLIMPEMNGRDLAKEMTSLYPDMMCLIMSGYTKDVIAHHNVLDKDVHFIQKPFSVQTLAAKVREVLDSGRA